MDKNYVAALEEELKKAMDIQDEYASVVNQLKEENHFLSDTLLTNNLGQIAIERRELLAENYRLHTQSQAEISEAAVIKDEYNKKLEEYNQKLKDVESKQAEIKNYIDMEADKKIQEIKADYQKKKNDNDTLLKEHMIENDKLLQEQIKSIKGKNKYYILIIIFSILFGTIGIIINFI